MVHDRATIRRLRNGLVPSWEFDRISVGYNGVRKRIGLSLSSLDLPGELVPLFVRGEWGTGKTHLLSFIRLSAENCGVASAIVDLNARGAALNHPQRFLRSIAETFRAAGFLGLKSVLRNFIEDPRHRSHLLEFAAGTKCIGDLSWALSDICRRFGDLSSVDIGEHPLWQLLHGVDLSWSDSPVKRYKAIERISTVAQICRVLGLRGLVLTFDEAETIDQLWTVKSRIAGYDVLERLIELDGLWIVIATTSRFDGIVDSDAKRQADIAEEAMKGAKFLDRWRNSVYQKLDPPLIGRQEALQLADAILDIYQNAYGGLKTGPLIARRCIAEWTQTSNQNPRRLIRSIVHSLDVARAPAFDRLAC